MKKILKKILPKNLKIFIIEHKDMFKIIKIKYKKKLERLFYETKDKSLMIDNEKKWINKLVNLAYSNIEFTKLGEAFINDVILVIKSIEILPSDIILICVEKNDLIKLRKFIKHHRKIGIYKFVILDNDSNDGTVEWLLKQNDVFLLQTKVKYSSTNRDAWINRIIAFFGDNRWYIILDSDELLVYNNYEKKKIEDVIEYLTINNIVRARALMLDMYAKSKYYESGEFKDYLDECIYFDTDTYYLKEREDFIHISGGPRERIFNISTCLTKYPLFYFKTNDVYCRSHYLYPYKENFNKNCILAIKHYHFLPGEIGKYRKIVKEKNYYNESIAYKKILDVMEKSKSLNFMCKNTCKFYSSNSLNNIKLYEKINWDCIK